MLVVNDFLQNVQQVATSGVMGFKNVLKNKDLRSKVLESKVHYQGHFVLLPTWPLYGQLAKPFPRP